MSTLPGGSKLPESTEHGHGPFLSPPASPVLPAVEEPPVLKEGFSLARPSMVVLGRIPSSWTTVIVLSVPLSSWTVVVTGTISAWK